MLSCRLVCLTRQIDRSIGLQGQYAQLQTIHMLGQSPQTIQERTTIVEIVGYQLAVGIQSGTIATIADAEE